jgi:hypothetical protein
MSRRLSVAIFLLLCFTTEARAGPVPATLRAGENHASSQDERIGSAADYIQTLNLAVTISRIGVSVRDGRTELIDGHEVDGVEVIDACSRESLRKNAVMQNGRECSSRTGWRARSDYPHASHRIA